MLLHPHQLRSPTIDESTLQFPFPIIAWCGLPYSGAFSASSLTLARHAHLQQQQQQQQQQQHTMPPPSPSSFLSPHHHHERMEDGGLTGQPGGPKAARALVQLGVITRREYRHLLTTLSFVKPPPSPPPLPPPLPPAVPPVPPPPPHAAARPPPRRLDPISLEPLCEEEEGGTHTFCFSSSLLPSAGGEGGREGGKEERCEVVYNVRSLCEYLVATGRFVEPTSRRVIESWDVQVGREGGREGRGEGREGGRFAFQARLS